MGLQQRQLQPEDDELACAISVTHINPSMILTIIFRVKIPCIVMRFLKAVRVSLLMSKVAKNGAVAGSREHRKKKNGGRRGWDGGKEDDEQ
ncbi:hypothetical protein GOBAR_DD09119 [Gossypium barbadense]|nr:hypothetical protein GOBAR_DD09119 [Gossypium barbadense]